MGIITKVSNGIVKNKNFVLAGALVVGLTTGHASALSGTSDTASADITATSGSLPGITVERDVATTEVSYNSNLIVDPIGNVN